MYKGDIPGALQRTISNYNISNIEKNNQENFLILNFSGCDKVNSSIKNTKNQSLVLILHNSFIVDQRSPYHVIRNSIYLR